MTSELTKALIAFHQKVPTIHKTAKSYTNQYAPLDEVLSVVTPALSAQGLTFTHIFEPQGEGQQPLLVCTLHHISGETLASKLPLVVQQGKHATQDVGSAITYLKRYTLLAVLGLTADVDTDGNLDEPAPVTKSKPSPASKPPAAKKEAVAPAPEPTAPADLPVSPEDLDQLLKLIVAHEKRDLVMRDFREEFGLPSDAKIKPAITSQVHADALKALILKHE